MRRPIIAAVQVARVPPTAACSLPSERHGASCTSTRGLGATVMAVLAWAAAGPFDRASRTATVAAQKILGTGIDITTVFILGAHAEARNEVDGPRSR